MANQILVVPATLIQKIDDNRGDISRAEFINALINDSIDEKPEYKINHQQDYVTRTELISIEQDMKQLLKSFLDFFLVYRLDYSENHGQTEIEIFTNQLRDLQEDLGNGKGNKGINDNTPNKRNP